MKNSRFCGLELTVVVRGSFFEEFGALFRHEEGYGESCILVSHRLRVSRSGTHTPQPKLSGSNPTKCACLSLHLDLIAWLWNNLALFLSYCTTSNLFFFHTVETLLFSAQIRKVMKPHSFRRSRILVWCPVCGGRPGTALDPVVG